MAEERTTPWYHVDKRLLPVKGIYFLFVADKGLMTVIATGFIPLSPLTIVSKMVMWESSQWLGKNIVRSTAIGDLLPFIPIYMKQLGLSSTEAGIIYGVMPFISFFVRPIFGAIADKTKQHKLVMMVCMLLTGILYCLLLVTPPKPEGTNVSSGVRTQIQCGQMDSFVRDCEDILNNGTVTHLQMCDISLQQLFRQYNMTDRHANCEVSCKISSPFVANPQVCFTQDVGAWMSNSCLAFWNGTSKESKLLFTIMDIEHVLDSQILGGNMTQNGQVCNDFDIKNMTYKKEHYWQFVCNTDMTFDCLLSCGEEFHRTCLSITSLSKTFWVFFVIFLFGNIFFAPVVSLVDAIAYDILGERRGLWGRQRNWGTIGFILFALTSTFIMDTLSRSSQKIDYSISFYIFVALCTCSCIVTYFVQLSETFHCNRMFKNLRDLLKYPEIVVFLVVVTVFGILNSVIEAFLFWFLKDLGSSQITLGLCLVSNCIPEAIMLYFAGHIMKKIGEVPCIYLGALAYAIRFFCYSFLTNAWYVLPVEVLHCFTFGLFYAAASAYGSKITPPGMSGTVQGLIGGLYFGFGKGIGSLVTGKLLEPKSGLGSRWTFRFYGFVSLFLLLVYATIQTLFFRKSTESPSKTPVTKEASDGDAAAADDLLLGNNTVSNENSAL